MTSVKGLYKIVCSMPSLSTARVLKKMKSKIFVTYLWIKRQGVSLAKIWEEAMMFQMKSLKENPFGRYVSSVHNCFFCNCMGLTSTRDIFHKEERERSVNDSSWFMKNVTSFCPEQYSPITKQKHGVLGDIVFHWIYHYFYQSQTSSYN